MSENNWTENVNFYADIFEKLSLTELSVEDGDKKLTLKKEFPPAPHPGMMPPYAGQPPMMPPGTQNAPGASVKASGSGEEAAEEAGYDKVKAPLLGMFHAAPSPEEAPYVKVGDHVSKGDTLCIIEAMKMMNDITCPRDGVIKKICVEENEIVEYGQPLFLLA